MKNDTIIYEKKKTIPGDVLWIIIILTKKAF